MGCPSTGRQGSLGKGEGSFLKQVGVSRGILSVPTLCCCKKLKSLAFGGGRRKWVDRSGVLMRRVQLFSVVPHRGSRRPEASRRSWKSFPSWGPESRPSHQLWGTAAAPTGFSSISAFIGCLCPSAASSGPGPTPSAALSPGIG